MASCQSCGQVVPEAARFCLSCGERIASNPVITADVTSPTPVPIPNERRPSKPRSSSGSSSATSSGTSSGREGRFLPGTLLAARYRIVAVLGKGGMGEVYRADDLILDQPVALKFLPEAVDKDEDALERFRNEIRIARRVSHPNVCRVYDVGEVEGHDVPLHGIRGWRGPGLAAAAHRPPAWATRPWRSRANFAPGWPRRTAKACCTAI